MRAVSFIRIWMLLSKKNINKYFLKVKKDIANGKGVRVSSKQELDALFA